MHALAVEVEPGCRLTPLRQSRKLDPENGSTSPPNSFGRDGGDEVPVRQGGDPTSFRLWQMPAATLLL